MPVFETERLQVRRWAPGDVEGVFTLYHDRAVSRWIDMPIHHSREDSARGLETLMGRYTAEDPAKSWWAITLHATGEVIGNGGVHPVFEGREVEVGYHIAQAHWGRGYATEYAVGAIRYGLQQLGLPRLIAVTIPTNVASQRVMVKAGMQPAEPVDFQGYWSVQYRAVAGAWTAPRLCLGTEWRGETRETRARRGAEEESHP